MDTYRTASKTELRDRRKLHERLMKNRSIQLVRSSATEPSLMTLSGPPLQMPDLDELNHRFGRALENLDLKGDSKKVVENYTDKQKWNLVCINDSLQAKHPVDYYVKNMTERLQFQQMCLEGKKIKSRIFDQNLLSNLEISLRTNSVEWVKEFLNESNKGLDLILNHLCCALDSIRYDLNPKEALSKPLFCQEYGYPIALHTVSSLSLNKTSSTPSVEKIDQAKDKFFTVPSTDIHTCIKCIKAIMNHAGGFQLVFTHPRAINIMVLSLRDMQIKTKVIVLNLISVLCLVHSGHDKVLQAFDNFKMVFHDAYRFSFLTGLLKKTDDAYIELMSTCLRCINLIVHSTADMNLEVFFQQEFKHLNFEDTLNVLRLLDIEILTTQINAYKANYIDVKALKEEKQNIINSNKSLQPIEADVINNNHLNCTCKDEELIITYKKESDSNKIEIDRLKLLIDQIQKRKKYRLRLCVDTTALRSWIVH